MNQWEYLEVILDLSKKAWRDSEGRRGRLRKGSVALALNELGIDGWELVTSLHQGNLTHRLLLKRPWPPDGGSGADGAGLADSAAASGSTAGADATDSPPPAAL